MDKMKMKLWQIALALIAPIAAVQAQPAPPAEKPLNVGQYQAHVVLITRSGPNRSNAAQFPAEIRAHKALWTRLNAEGKTIGGGFFEGQPSMGMTIFSPGIDEAQARELIKDDPYPKLGIAQYEFRTFRVVDGSFRRP
jgi:hypothetical protein